MILKQSVFQDLPKGRIRYVTRIAILLLLIKNELSGHRRQQD
jgi:hypothetical protein